MRSPEGEKYHGWGKVLAVDPPRRLEVKDGFADDTGKPDDDLPVGTMVVTLAERDRGAEVVITSHFPTLEAMEQVLAMGQEEGMVQAIGQIDAILAGTAPS